MFFKKYSILDGVQHRARESTASDDTKCVPRLDLIVDDGATTVQ